MANGGQMLTMIFWEHPIGDPRAEPKFGRSELRLVEGAYSFDKARVETNIIAEERGEGRHQMRNLSPLLEQKGLAVIDRALLAKLLDFAPEVGDMSVPVQLEQKEQEKVEAALHFYEYPPGGGKCRCDRCVDASNDEIAILENASRGLEEGSSA